MPEKAHSLASWRAMPRLQDTAYPRLKSVLSARDLAAAFTPTGDELALARSSARGSAAQLGFLVLLKLFQRLGRPVPVSDAPSELIEVVTTPDGHRHDQRTPV
jgi:uncharacterized protein DUF4158